VFRQTKDHEALFVDERLLREIDRIFRTVAGIVVRRIVERLLRDDEILACGRSASQHVGGGEDSDGNTRDCGRWIACLEAINSL